LRKRRPGGSCSRKRVSPSFPYETSPGHSLTDFVDHVGRRDPWGRRLLDRRGPTAREERRPSRFINRPGDDPKRRRSFGKQRHHALVIPVVTRERAGLSDGRTRVPPPVGTGGNDPRPAPRTGEVRQGRSESMTQNLDRGRTDPDAYSPLEQYPSDSKSARILPNTSRILTWGMGERGWEIGGRIRVSGISGGCGGNRKCRRRG
jgi:hypothetical protein